MEPLGVFLLEEVSFLSFFDDEEEEVEERTLPDVVEPLEEVDEGLELDEEDLELDDEVDFSSLFFSLVPLLDVLVVFVFFLSVLETSVFSGFIVEVRDESAFFCVLFLFSMGSPYILLKARSSFSERCRSSLSERSKPTRIPR